MCHAEKQASEFTKNASTRDGLGAYCKSCNVIVCARLKHTRAKAYKRWAAANRELRKASNKAYYDRNADARVAASLLWQKQNPGLATAKTQMRRARVLQATTQWADKEWIAFLYSECGHMNQIGLRGKFHVDHIVPLRSKKVCGLHTHDNLQIIPAKDNLSKLNRYWPEMT